MPVLLLTTAKARVNIPVLFVKFSLKKAKLDIIAKR